MKRSKTLCMIAMMCFCMMAAIICCPTNVKAKTTTYNMILMKGDTLTYEYWNQMKKLTVSNKSIIKVTDMNKVNYEWKLKVKGLKKGTATITYKQDKDTMKIKVTVLDDKKVKAKASKLLKAKIKKLKKKTKYIYYDLDKDGMKDLIVNNKIYYYNYRDGKVKSRSFKNIKDFYASEDGKGFYVVYAKPKEYEEFSKLGEFYLFDDHYIFKWECSGTGFRKYTKAGLKAWGFKQDAEPYWYQNGVFDQDDCHYDTFSKETMMKMMCGQPPKGLRYTIDYLLKNGKLLKWTTK